MGDFGDFITRQEIGFVLFKKCQTGVVCCGIDDQRKDGNLILIIHQYISAWRTNVSSPFGPPGIRCASIAPAI